MFLTKRRRQSEAFQTVLALMKIDKEDFLAEYLSSVYGKVCMYIGKNSNHSWYEIPNFYNLLNHSMFDKKANPVPDTSIHIHYGSRILLVNTYLNLHDGGIAPIPDEDKLAEFIGKKLVEKYSKSELIKNWMIHEKEI
jgi:hypothetical protein